MENKTKVLSQATVKYIVIILMVIDHAVQTFLPETNPFYLAGRIISRLTGPVMAFFIAEGYYYTHNVKKYLLRLGIFAIISSIAFTLFEAGTPLIIHLADKPNALENSCAWIYISSLEKYLTFVGTSVIFTLFLGLLAILMWDKAKIPAAVKVLITILILYAACFGDWNYWNILFCLIFYFLRNNKKIMWPAFIAVALLYIFNIKFVNMFDFSMEPKFMLYRTGILLVPIFIELFYNGLPGKKCSFNKWFFYIFYPGHLIILYILKLLLK